MAAVPTPVKNLADAQILDKELTDKTEGAGSVADGTAMKIRLSYFNIQGEGEKVRLAFVLGGIAFEDVRVPFNEWGAMKATTPYGQLPLLTIDDRVPIAQSGAMLRFAGKLANDNGVGLYPIDTPEKILAIEEAMGLVGDLKREWRPPLQIGMDPTVFGYPTDMKGTETHGALVKAMREAFVENKLPRYMGFLSKRLGDGDYLCGAEPTIADCELVPVLNRFSSGGVDYVPVSCLEPYPEVTSYIERFMALPAVKAWYAPKEGETA
jgi:glutathione S-transferase